MRTYEYFAVVELLGLSTKLKLPIRARGMPGGLRLSPPSIFFGDVPTHTWADQLVTLTNTNTLLPARFQVRAVEAGSGKRWRAAGVRGAQGLWLCGGRHYP